MPLSPFTLSFPLFVLLAILLATVRPLLRTTQLCLRAATVWKFLWVHLRFIQMYHSLGLHSKMKHKLYQPTTADQQDRPCTALQSWGLPQVSAPLSRSPTGSREKTNDEKHKNIGGLDANIGRVDQVTAATAEKKRLRTCDPWVGKFPIGSRKIIDIGSKNPCIVATTEEKILWIRD